MAQRTRLIQNSAVSVELFFAGTRALFGSGGYLVDKRKLMNRRGNHVLNEGRKSTELALVAVLRAGKLLLQLVEYLSLQ